MLIMLIRKEYRRPQARNTIKKSDLGNEIHLLQNRVTDHRFDLTLSNLDRVMDGDLGELIQSLQAC
jgi:protein subunit release factor A